MRPQRLARRHLPLPILLALAFTILLGATPAAARTPSVRLDVTRPTATSITATAVGAPLAGTWRITVAGTGARAGRAAQVTIVTGDDRTYGSLAFGRLDGAGRFRAAETHDLTPYLGSRSAAVGFCDPDLRACFNTAAIRVPARGDSTLRVTFTSRVRGARFDLSAAVRVNHDAAFTLGRWIRTGLLRI